MQGHKLTEALHRDFAIRGTASQAVFAMDEKTGKIYSIVGVRMETHEDATLPCTHWILIEES